MLKYDENWLDVFDYEGLYKLDQSGNVWGVKRKKKLKIFKYRGFDSVSLCKDGEAEVLPLAVLRSLSGWKKMPYYEIWPINDGESSENKIERSENKNEGKVDPTLILKDMPNFFEEILKVRQAGVVKYSRNNWVLSCGTDDAERFLDENMASICRHLLAYIKGEVLDQESGAHHLAHLALRCGFALEYWARQGEKNGN